MLKILNICHLYYPSFGGCQIYMKELSEKLVALGEEVTVLTPQAVEGREFKRKGIAKSVLPKTETINGVIVRRFPIRHNLYEMIFHRIGKIMGGYRLVHSSFDDATLKNLKKGPFIPDMIFEIMRYKPDVVILLSVHKAHSYLCYVAKKLMNFPLMVIPSLHIWKYDAMVHKILKIADAVIAFTEHEKEAMVKNGIDEAKITVIGNGIEPSRFQKADRRHFRDKHHLDGDPVVTFIGGKAKGKGVEMLIDAMDIVWKDIQNAKLVLAGKNNNEYEPIIQEKLNSLSRVNKNNIIDISEFSDEEKPDIFAACDVFAMASKIDTFGIVYLEAWNSGKPVIACKDTPSATFMEDGKDALLVEYGNPQELATAIKRLLNDKKLSKAMGENGRKKVRENYTWDIITKRIREKCYQITENGQRKNDK